MLVPRHKGQSLLFPIDGCELLHVVSSCLRDWKFWCVTIKEFSVLRLLLRYAELCQQHLWCGTSQALHPCTPVYNMLFHVSPGTVGLEMFGQCLSTWPNNNPIHKLAFWDRCIAFSFEMGAGSYILTYLWILDHRHLCGTQMKRPRYHFMLFCFTFIHFTKQCYDPIKGYCGDLDENGPHGLRGSGIIRLGVASSEEVCRWGRGLRFRKLKAGLMADSLFLLIRIENCQLLSQHYVTLHATMFPTIVIMD